MNLCEDMPKRLRELYANAKARGLNLRLAERHGPSLYGIFLVPDDSRRQEIEELLSEFEDVLDGYEICEPLPEYPAETLLDLPWYESLQGLAEKELQAISSQLEEMQLDDDIYALTIGADPEECGLYFSVSCQRDFELALRKKQDDKEFGHLYTGKERVALFKYYGHQSHGFYASKELQMLLHEKQDIGFSDYSRFGDVYLSWVSPTHFELMTDSLARAVRATESCFRSRLPTANDFLAYVSYFDEQPSDNYRAARRTLSQDEVKLTMAPIFERYFAADNA